MMANIVTEAKAAVVRVALASEKYAYRGIHAALDRIESAKNMLNPAETKTSADMESFGSLLDEASKAIKAIKEKTDAADIANLDDYADAFGVLLDLINDSPVIKKALFSADAPDYLRGYILSEDLRAHRPNPHGMVVPLRHIRTTVDKIEWTYNYISIDDDRTWLTKTTNKIYLAKIRHPRRGDDTLEIGLSPFHPEIYYDQRAITGFFENPLKRQDIGKHTFPYYKDLEYAESQGLNPDKIVDALAYTVSLMQEIHVKRQT